MTRQNLTPIYARNRGDSAEWSWCAACGVERNTHDSKSYMAASDCHFDSVKASGFTLMSGNLCHGCESFDGIWTIYESNTHSKRFVYVTREYVAYVMNLAEFKQFVYAFGYLERESQKNGGALKIRCRKESGKMLAWLNNMAA